MALFNESLVNSTGEDDTYNRPSSFVGVLTSWIIISLFIILGNGLVCIVILKVKQMQTQSNFLLVNLAVAGMLVVPSSFVAIYDALDSGDTYGAFACKLQTFALSVIYAVSILTHVGIAVERFYAVCRPLKFYDVKKRLKRIIIAIWLCAIVVYSPMWWSCTLHNTERQGKSQLSCNCYSKWPKWYIYACYGVFIFTLLYLIPIIAMLRCYVSIVYAVKSSSCRITDNTLGREEQTRSITKMFIVLVSVFLIMWTPYNILYILKRFHVDFRSVYGIVWYGSLFLAYFSYCCNPVIYTIMSGRYRQALKTLFRIQGAKRTEYYTGTSQPIQTRSGSNKTSVTTIETIM